MAEKKKQKKIVRVLTETSRDPKETNNAVQRAVQKAIAPPSQPRKPMAARRTRSG